VHGQGDLPQSIRGASLLDGDQQQPEQHRHDGQDYQQFQQREPPTSLHDSTPCSVRLPKFAANNNI
jgi:hypothetical protein